MNKRIIIDFALFVAVFIAGPILPMVAGLFLLYYFESFYEIIFIGLIIDVLYGLPIHSLNNFTHPMAFIALILFTSSILIKRWLKFYSNR